MAKPRLKFQPGDKCFVKSSSRFSRLREIAKASGNENDFMYRYNRTTGREGEVLQHKYGEYQVKVQLFGDKEDILWFTPRELEKPIERVTSRNVNGYYTYSF